jgi:exodeoxyribonuclease V alpha subunit
MPAEAVDGGEVDGAEVDGGGVDGGPMDGSPAVGGDPYRADLVLGTVIPELLRRFNLSGVLVPADVHAALRLAQMAGEDDATVILAAALTVRGSRVGHVSVDLADVRRSTVVGEDDVDLDTLPWPGPEAWMASVAASPLVANEGDAGESSRPLRLGPSGLYLDRFWRDEVALADDLLARAPADTGQIEPDSALLDRLCPGPESADQRMAVSLAVTRRLAVIAGGPGTGKTTTVARTLAILFEEASRDGRRPPLVALAAPTGKAAVRMEEAVRAEAQRLDAGEEVRIAMAGLRGTTLHRLLGVRPDRPGRFRHHRGHRLPHDVVVVDEASMVSLPLMARLVEAVRHDARLIVVGDPEQLVSVEAGAVLADIVAPAPTALSDSICVLRTNHRFAGGLALLAEAVRAGDAGAAIDLLRSGDSSATWIEAEPGEMVTDGSFLPAGNEVAAQLVEWAGHMRGAAESGDMEGAVAALAQHRVLCAHRRGTAGVGEWNLAIERLLGDRAAGPTAGPTAGRDAWYPGRPVIVTANDYSLKLFNGDTGVVLADPAATALRVVFDDGGGRRRTFSPSRLDAVETVYAMTIHKSQGSEFDRVTLLMPPASSRLLTRELLYTAVTRARHHVLVVGREEALVGAIERPIAQASGLADRLSPT